MESSIAATPEVNARYVYTVMSSGTALMNTYEELQHRVMESSTMTDSFLVMPSALPMQYSDTAARQNPGLYIAIIIPIVGQDNPVFFSFP